MFLSLFFIFYGCFFTYPLYLCLFMRAFAVLFLLYRAFFVILQPFFKWTVYG